VILEALIEPRMCEPRGLVAVCEIAALPQHELELGIQRFDLAPEIGVDSVHAAVVHSSAHAAARGPFLRPFCIGSSPSLLRVESHLEVSVADTGQGIRPEFLPFVFDRFRQADAGPRREQGGLGLGLAIVRHLVELHGGTVTARSSGAGTGATFQVLLPLN
jgi:signal transduction histidine kinase